MCSDKPRLSTAFMVTAMMMTCMGMRKAVGDKGKYVVSHHGIKDGCVKCLIMVSELPLSLLLLPCCFSTAIKFVGEMLLILEQRTLARSLPKACTRILTQY